MGPQPPFLVAHRAGNDLVALRRAEALGIRHVEADVRLFRGEVEVRHEKSVGPLPLFWDRGRLTGPRAPRLRLDELLAGCAPETELMLDLKGLDGRLAPLVLAALERAQRERVSACARNWSLLAPLRAAGVRTVPSVRTRRQLARLLEARPARRLEGVSVHASLLTPATVRELGRAAEAVLTWPVAAAARARELAAWGVHGLITERLELAQELSRA